jgi:hypothetical protein
VLSLPIKLIQAFAGGLSRMFDGLSGDKQNKALNFVGNFGTKLADGLKSADFTAIGSMINTGLFAVLVVSVKKIFRFFKEKVSVFKSITESISGSFEALTKSLTAMTRTLQAATLMEIAIAVGILAASLSTLSKIDIKHLSTAMGAITIMFAELFGSMLIFTKLSKGKGFTNLRSTVFTMILLAISIDILASAVAKLGALDWQGLAKGLIGLTVLLGSLVLVAKGLDKHKKDMVRIGLSFIVMAVGIRILASSVAKIGSLDWSGLAKGLIGTGAVMGGLVLFLEHSKLDKVSRKKLFGLILLAESIKIIAKAVTIFKDVSWEQMGRGLIATGAIIGAMVLFMHESKLEKINMTNTAGLVLLAVAIRIMAESMKVLAEISATGLIKSVLALHYALEIIVNALSEIKPMEIISAGAIVSFIHSLSPLLMFLLVLGGMSWPSLIKAGVAFQAVMETIVWSIKKLNGSLLGSLALLAISTGIAALSVALVAFGDMSVAQIVTSLLTVVAIVGIFAGIAALIDTFAAALLTVDGVIVAFSGTLFVFAASLAAVGLGLIVFSAGLSAFAVGTVGITATLVSYLTAVIPAAFKAFAEGFIVATEAIAKGAPRLAKAFTEILLSMLATARKVFPQIVATGLMMLFMLLDALVKAIPKMVDAGMKIVLGILKGINNNIDAVAKQAFKLVLTLLTTFTRMMPTVMKHGAKLLVAFLKGIGDNIGSVADAAAKLIIKFVNGVADAINKHKKALSAAGQHLGGAVVGAMGQYLLDSRQHIVDSAKSIADKAIKAVGDKLYSWYAKVNPWAKDTKPAASKHVNQGLKSFADVAQNGSEITDGMSEGVTRFSDTMGYSSAGVDAFKQSLSRLSKIDLANLDLHPVITPVLDLTAVAKEALKINAMLAIHPLSVDVSYVKAKTASIGHKSSISHPDHKEVQPLTFNQYNHSPKALSTIDIYRQTKNQLSVAKGALSK